MVAETKTGNLLEIASRFCRREARHGAAGDGVRQGIGDAVMDGGHRAGVDLDVLVQWLKLPGQVGIHIGHEIDHDPAARVHLGVPLHRARGRNAQ